MAAKIITPDAKLRALAVFTVAHQHYLKVREYERALAEILPSDDDDDIYRGCVSDELYNDSQAPNFDRALKREGYVVAKRKRR